VFAILALLATMEAAASERYALVVTGASGGPQYAQKYDTWRTSFVTILRENLKYPDDHIVVLAEDDANGAGKATREGVKNALGRLRAQTTKSDVVVVLLIGHGSGADGDEAKFNLVGPDLGVSEWAELLRPIPARVVFVDTASGSFPFLQKIAGPNRIVLTANDSPAQQFETVFPDFFVKAFQDDDADADKNGRVSVWEAFRYASEGVRRWFEERGQLATERALLDDSGAGVGREANAQGRDGPVAQVTYLAPDRPIPETGNPAQTALLQRRAALEADLEALRARKPNMPADEYESALERLLLEIAQLDRRLRTGSR
jgi:hypothetical protein